MQLLKPKEFKVVSLDGDELTFWLSRFPAVAGREIITQYAPSALPKLGNYEINHSLMLRLMSYVAVARQDAEPLRLTTQALIDNHVPDAETLMKIEFAMFDYNTSFFQSGKISNFLESGATKLLGLASEMLTQSLQKSSAKGSQP